MMTRVLVFGATGFLGDQVRRLLEQEYVPCTGIFAARRPAGTGSAWLTFGLAGASRSDLAALLESTRPDVVVNCVGAISGPPATLQAANLDAVARLVDALKAYCSRVPTGPVGPARRVRRIAGGRPEQATRLVHLGSAAEYGPHEPGHALDEETPCRPADPYGETKLAATTLIQEAVWDGRIDATVLRVFNPVGEGAPVTTLAGSAAIALGDALATGAKAIELGSLDSWRDFVDSRDVARAAVLAAIAPGSGAPAKRCSSVLNVGRGEAVSARWLVGSLAAVAGFTGEIIERPAGPPRSADVRWQQADITAVRKRLGWQPEHTLAESLACLWHGARPTTAGH